MKNILKYTPLLFCLLTALLPAACDKQPLADMEQTQNATDAAPDTETLTACIEPATKTTYNSFEGKFAWSGGDFIAVHYNDGSYEPLSVDPSGGAVNAPSSASRKRDFYAVYPASAVEDPGIAANYGNTILQVNFPDTYDITDIVNGTVTGKGFEYSPCPMVAINDTESGILFFRHVGGLLRMKMSLLDARSAYVCFTFDKDVTGTYTVADPGTDHPAVTTNGTDGNNIVTVILNDGDAIGYRSFNEPFYINVPVPCGSYNNIKVEIFDIDSQPQESATIPSLNVTRQHGQKFSFFEFHDRRLTAAYVPGKFSVSDTKNVYFASGNLLVENTLRNGVNYRVWKFEQNQWGFHTDIDQDSGYSVEGVTYPISHFGWATAGIKNPEGPVLSSSFNYYGFDTRHIHYEPSSVARDSYLYGPSFNYDEYGDYVWSWADDAELPVETDSEDNSWNKNRTVRRYCDWGVHFDEAGIGHEDITEIEGGMGAWYTLSINEWTYLMHYDSRNEAPFRGSATLFIASENRTVFGLVILPDVWALPVGCSFKTGGERSNFMGYSSNRYTTGTDATGYDGLWSAMEAAGAVFLPAAGARNGTTIGIDDYHYGHYWSSSASDEGSSMQGVIFFSDPENGYDTGYASPLWGWSRYGNSVRLVHDTNVNF